MIQVLNAWLKFSIDFAEWLLMTCYINMDLYVLNMFATDFGTYSVTLWDPVGARLFETGNWRTLRTRRWGQTWLAFWTWQCSIALWPTLTTRENKCEPSSPKTSCPEALIVCTLVTSIHVVMIETLVSTHGECLENVQLWHAQSYLQTLACLAMTHSHLVNASTNIPMTTLKKSMYKAPSYKSVHKPFHHGCI